MKKKTSLTLLKQEKKIDYWIFLITIFLCIFGLLMIYESSNVVAFKEFGDKYFYVKDQLLWFIIGISCLIINSKISYKKYYYLSVPILIICIISLILVFIPGVGIKLLGAHRWIKIAGFNFQPSELAKISLILYLSSWLSAKEKKRFIAFLLLLLVIVGLVILQPDLGTAVILSTILVSIYFLSQASIGHFIFLIPFAFISILLLAILSPYRLERIMTFLNPNYDPLGSSYHIRQILISFGSGGIWGLGLGSSRQKYQFLPEATTDSIFAIIGEEFGFIGTFLFITLILIYLYRMYLIVKNAPDKHSFLLSGGILVFISIQIIINLGAMVALFPLTGVPLPFISYGGSNLIVILFSIGILLNISKYAIRK